MKLGYHLLVLIAVTSGCLTHHTDPASRARLSAYVPRLHVAYDYRPTPYQQKGHMFRLLMVWNLEEILFGEKEKYAQRIFLLQKRLERSFFR